MSIDKSDSAGDTQGSEHPFTQEIESTYADVFSEKLQGLPPKRKLFHTIPMTAGHVPPARAASRLAPPEYNEAYKQVHDLLEQGLVRPSCSPYSSPVLFVTKKDGSYRMVIDYRAVNRLTTPDRYPLPRIDDLIDKLHGAQCFTSLDLLSGYHQVRLKEEDIPKTAFRVPFGHYEFLVLPFGLTNAPATFQRMMNDVFHDFIAEGFVIVYLDDVLIYSKTEDEHKTHLHCVFTRLREHQLFAKRKKCTFFQPELQYLGFIVGKHGQKPVTKYRIPDTKYRILTRLFPFLSGLAQPMSRRYANSLACATSSGSLCKGTVPWLFL
jgi:hypothetical protein